MSNYSENPLDVSPYLAFDPETQIKRAGRKAARARLASDILSRANGWDEIINQRMDIDEASRHNEPATSLISIPADLNAEKKAVEKDFEYQARFYAKESTDRGKTLKHYGVDVYHLGGNLMRTEDGLPIYGASLHVTQHAEETSDRGTYLISFAFETGESRRSQNPSNVIQAYISSGQYVPGQAELAEDLPASMVSTSLQVMGRLNEVVQFTKPQPRKS